MHLFFGNILSLKKIQIIIYGDERLKIRKKKHIHQNHQKNKLGDFLHFLLALILSYAFFHSDSSFLNSMLYFPAFHKDKT